MTNTFLDSLSIIRSFGYYSINITSTEMEMKVPDQRNVLSHLQSAAHSFEMLATTYMTIQYHDADDNNPHFNQCENLKLH
jgi:hypothetical protein